MKRGGKRKLKQGGTRGAAALCVAMSGAAAMGTTGVTLTPVASNAYFAGDVNSCAIDLNNITTYRGYQFLAYYNTGRHIVIARRPTGGGTWQTYDSGISISSTFITDDHNVIAIGVDATGTMHMSWNMHNVSLNYAMSTASVLNPSLSSISFTQLNSSNSPSLFPSAGSTTNEVTYPTFFHVPNSDKLLFSYRNGGAGGGSGNGNQYMDVYDPATNRWSQSFVINGEQTSVNAYLNSLVYTPTGNLLMTWTWRATPNWQTNSNIMFAQSPDNGVTWFQQGGATQYGLPIIQNGTPAESVGQVIKNIPQNSSFINQTSMAADEKDRPMVASYWVPTAATGDPSRSYPAGYVQRQYMLAYYTGTQWATSQVSNRTSDTFIDTSGADVRDLGRPIVLVDKANRILVVTRSEDTGMGSASNPATPNNNVVVYYTTDSMTGGGMLPTTLHWKSVALDSANMGIWEPTYDSGLWAASNQLDLFYEPMGLSGQSTGNLSVLGWDEAAYFAMTWGSAGISGDGATWNTAAMPGSVNFVNGAGASGFHIGDTVTFNDHNGGHYGVGISGTVLPMSVTVDNSAGNYVFSGTGSIGGATGIMKNGIGTLTLATANIFTGGTVVNGGTVVVANPMALGTGGLTIHAGGTVQLQAGLGSAVVLPAVQLDGGADAWEGTLDVGGNKLVVRNAATHAMTLATLQNEVAYGAAHGTGIVSTSLAPDTALAVMDNAVLGLTTFGDVAVNANSILVAPELLGDANVDGAVDLTDLSVVLDNFGKAEGTWTSGNFDGAGVIDLSDLSFVLNHFGKRFAGARVGGNAQAAPEAGTLGVLVMGVMGLLGRRRA
ncbi:MAG: BNR-4 repeat-containing protein [Phycisphaerae bacterium]